MPGVYVFPGGRVEWQDRRPSGFPEHLAEPPPGLDRHTERGLVRFARTALRETFEETGLLLAREGRACGPLTGPPWEAFAAAGLRPAFEGLRLVARATTPADRPIRFHTRFFLAEGELLQGEIKGDGELEDLGWIPIAELDAWPVRLVTRLVLSEALAHRTDHRRKAASFWWRRDPAV